MEYRALMASCAKLYWEKKNASIHACSEYVVADGFA